MTPDSDGDAFRLAVAQRIDLCFEKLHAVSAWSVVNDGWITEFCEDPAASDILEATRRVIGRAALAAKIGE